MGNFMFSSAMVVKPLDPITLAHPNDQVNRFTESPHMADWLIRNLPPSGPMQAGPAPAPAPAAPVVAKDAAPAILIIEDMTVYTVNGELGVLTPPFSTFDVPGNSVKTKYVSKTQTVETSQALSSSALETSSQTSSDALTQDVHDASKASSSTDTFDYQLNSSVQVHGDVGLSSFDGSGSLAAKTSSTAVHNDASQAVDAAVQKQAMQTKSAVAQQSVSVSDSQVSSTSEVSVDMLVINNSGNPQSITYAMCRLAIEKVTALSLTDVRLGLYDAKANKTRIYGLHELDDLVNDCFADPTNRATVRQKIKDWVTRPVFDCNSEPQTFVSEVTQDGVTFLKANQDAQTVVKVPRTDGQVKSVTIPGIALSREYRVMPTDLVGAAKLIADQPV